MKLDSLERKCYKWQANKKFFKKRIGKGKVVNKTFSFPLSSYRFLLNIAELFPYFDILFIFNESEESISWPATYVLS